MWHQEELLKFIWHAFTALDVDHRGKVSKSQLKVLSHNICTMMKIPYDSVALEKYFKDEDTGPLSNQGYMPYLDTFILNKVQDDLGMSELCKFCWTQCYKKNISITQLLISHNNAFKVWCIFNFLSEDKYPLVIIPEEIEYLLWRLTSAMGGICCEEMFEYHIELSLTKSCLTAWELIELVGMHYCKDARCQTLSMGINEVYQELILDILKQGYMSKKCSKRQNWTEYWFVLRPNYLGYYVAEDLMEIKGMIALDSNCSVESLPDKEGKTCLFVIKCADTSFEIRVLDKTQKQEWIRAIEKCIELQKHGLPPPHHQARLRRRELWQRQHAAEEGLALRIKQLQAANESKQRELEAVKKKLEKEDERRRKTEIDLQDGFKANLEREKMVRRQMEEQVAQKSCELEHYLHRVKELEEMHHQLQEAFKDERQAKKDEEHMQKLQARLLEEEKMKRAELEQIHLQQQRELSQSEAEKQQLVAEQTAKERKLQEAMYKLKRLERERHAAVKQHEVKEVSRKLERVANKINTWKEKMDRHEGLVRLIQPDPKGPQIITNWGPAAFTHSELELRKKSWQESKKKGSAAQ